MTKSKVTSFRLEEEDLNKLEQLSKIYQIERTSLIKRYIEKDYKKIMEIGSNKVYETNDKIKKLLNNLIEYL